MFSNSNPAATHPNTAQSTRSNSPQLGTKSNFGVPKAAQKRMQHPQAKDHLSVESFVFLRLQPFMRLLATRKASTAAVPVVQVHPPGLTAADAPTFALEVTP